jgi:DNA-binding transcriptional LysR family regulator
MELRHLRYFIILAEELNFRRAAERLKIAQPPLSKQIRDLELELEVKLFERNQKRVLLTKAGKVFLTEVRLIMKQVDIAVTKVRQAHQGGAAKITIGFSAPGQQILGKVLAALENITPELEISLQELSISEQLLAIKQERIDLGLGYLPAFALLQRSGLAVKAIQPEKFYLAVSDQYLDRQSKISSETSSITKQPTAPDLKESILSRSLTERRLRKQQDLKQDKVPDPLNEDLDILLTALKNPAEQQNFIHLQQSINILEKSTFILAKDQWGDFAEIRMLEVLFQLKIKPQKIQEVSTMETALSLVAQDLGVTIINSAFYSFQRMGVKYIELAETIAEREIGLIWRADSSLEYLGKLVSVVKS